MLGLRCGAGLAPVVEAGGLPPRCGDGLLVAVDPPAAELQGSGAVAHELRCPAAGGIFLDRGSYLCPSQWQVDS